MSVCCRIGFKREAKATRKRRDKIVTYIERYTEAQAKALVAELKGEGYNAYFTKNNADSFTVQYWK